MDLSIRNPYLYVMYRRFVVHSSFFLFCLVMKDNKIVNIFTLFCPMWI